MIENFTKGVLEDMKFLSEFIDECSNYLVKMNQEQDKEEFRRLKGDIAFDLYCMGRIVDVTKRDLKGLDSREVGALIRNEQKGTTPTNKTEIKEFPTLNKNYNTDDVKHNDSNILDWNDCISD